MLRHIKLGPKGIFFARMIITFAVPLTGFANAGEAGENCIQHPYNLPATGDENDPVSIYQGIAPVFVHFPQLAEVVNSAAPEFCFSDQIEGALAYLDVDRNSIVVSKGMSEGLQNGVVIHELRHLEQFARGTCPSDNLAMEEYARAVFALEADASAISLMIAWEIKEKGDEAIWNALSAWSSQADIAESFAAELDRTNDLALATSSAFYQWYGSRARLEKYYVSTCSDFLDRQDDYHIIPMYQLVPDTFLEDLCTLPDGSSYVCSHPEVNLR